MTDPLSLAASVAGLLSLAGTVSKSAFQFITSILDAPEQARSLVSALYSLNVALGQVQGSLLDPKFVLQVDDSEDIRMLQECLTSCTAVFLELKTKVEDSGLEEAGSSGLQIRRRWEQVKWSFTDDETAGLLRRIESEKSTLGLVLNVFTAKLSAGILACVAQTEARSRKMDRRLKNIHVCLEWVIQKATQQEKTLADQQSSHSLLDEDCEVESSAFDASTAYTASDLANLLKSSGSVLSLSLSHTADGNVGAVWVPETEESIPLRSTIVEIKPGLPRLSTVNQCLFELTESRISPSSPNRARTINRMNTHRRVFSNVRKTAQFDLLITGSAAVLASMQYSISALSALSTAIKSAKNFNASMIEDISELGSKVASIQELIVVLPDDPNVTRSFDSMAGYVQEYCKWADRRMLNKGDSVGKVVASMASTVIRNEQQEMKRQVMDKVDAVLLLANNCFIMQTVKLQREQMMVQQDQMEQQLRMSEKLDQILFEMTPKDPARKEVPTSGLSDDVSKLETNDADGGCRVSV